MEQIHAKTIGPDRSQIWQQMVTDPVGGHAQQFLLLNEVGGEEDHEEELCPLEWLERDRTQLHPQFDPADVLCRVAEMRDERHDKEADSCKEQQVSVPLEIFATAARREE